MRVTLQPAFVLHSRPYRDTSAIIEVFTAEHGRLSVVARGVRKQGKKGGRGGLLQPFVPLLASFSGRAELKTLGAVESAGAPLVLVGERMFSGLYLNELLVRLLHRHDPQPEVFSAYEQTLEAISRGHDVAACLRHFEIELLRLLGYAMNLETDAVGDAPLDPVQHYEYRPAQGAVPVQREEGAAVFSGAELLAIGRESFDDEAVLREAGRLLRHVIHYHLDGRELKTRKVLKDLHRGRLGGPPEK